MGSHLWGVGLRPQHFAGLKVLAAAVPVLEIMADNLIHHVGGPALFHTDKLAERSAVVLHGVGLNVGGVDPLDLNYLEGLKRLVQRYKPAVVSDHLCFTRFHKYETYELLPVVRNARSLKWLCERVNRVQDLLGCRLSLENVSAYVSYQADDMSESAFFKELALRTGCGILLDVNNVFVSAANFGFDAASELLNYPLASVTQIHVAGHSVRGDHLFDTHDEPVKAEVWQLLAVCLAHLQQIDSHSHVPVILENDATQVPLETLLQEIALGQSVCGVFAQTLHAEGQSSESIRPQVVVLCNVDTPPLDIFPLHDTGVPLSACEHGGNYALQRAMVEWLTDLHSTDTAAADAAAPAITGAAASAPVASSLRGKSDSAAIASEEYLASALAPGQQHRLETYQTSYFGRITQALCESLFSPLEVLFGRECVVEVLATHFRDNRPSTPALARAALGLPEALRTAVSPASIDTEASALRLLFSDLIAVCLLRWEILTLTPDPRISAEFTQTLSSAAAGEAKRMRCRVRGTAVWVMPSGHHDLALAWKLGQEGDCMRLPSEIFEARTGCMLVKVSALQFCVFEVPETLAPLATALCAGLSLGKGLEILEAAETVEKGQKVEVEALISDVQNFVMALQAHGALEESALTVPTL